MFRGLSSACLITRGLHTSRPMAKVRAGRYRVGLKICVDALLVLFHNSINALYTWWKRWKGWRNNLESLQYRSNPIYFTTTLDNWKVFFSGYTGQIETSDLRDGAQPGQNWNWKILQLLQYWTTGGNIRFNGKFWLL